MRREKRPNFVFFSQMFEYVANRRENIWFDPKKIATKGFSTDLSSIGRQYEHIKNLKKSNFRKVLFSRWPPNH